MAFARVNCRAKIRRSTILPTARVHRNRHGAISRALDTLPNSISLTPVPAHRRRTFYLDGWITTWKCIFGPFCARLVPSFESWNLRRCKACRSHYGSTRRRRLQVTAAAQWKDLMEALQRGFQGVQDACVDAVSLKPLPAAWFRLVASWPSGGTTWRQGTGETTPRSIGLSVRLQARPSGAVWLSG